MRFLASRILDSKTKGEACVELDFHPWTAIFPRVNGDELAALASEIRRYGQAEPITVYDGMILDGRARYQACQLIGFEPKVSEFEPMTGMGVADDALLWMVQKNVSERHLTKAQLAAIAHSLLLLLYPKHKEKEPYSTQQLKQVADLVGASWSSVQRLVAVYKKKQRNGPKLIEEVRNGDLTVAQATRNAGFREYDDQGMFDNVYFGKGDRFNEAFIPMQRYLKGWETRDFEFTNVNPKEAARRLVMIEQLMDWLTEAKRDLEARAVKPSLRA